MRHTSTFIAVVTFILLTCSIAWAGGPESESPEPMAWAFLMLGAAPLAYRLYKQKS